MQIVGTTVLLLFCSNIFMTFAWYAHLRSLNGRSWLIAALVSWGVAFFEYCFQVPANRIGYAQLTLPQLKVLQEVITLVVFAPFAVLYMGQPLNSITYGLDCASQALCILFSAARLRAAEISRTLPTP